MKKANALKNQNGQALSELILAIPLLFLFAAGIIQFSIVFLSYVQFEHACGEAAREYAAGIVGKDSLTPGIIDNLGYFTRYFDLSTLSVEPRAPGSAASNAFENVRRSIGIIPHTLNFDGAEWNIKIRCRPPYFFTVLFPQGLPFKTILQVYRYPS